MQRKRQTQPHHPGVSLCLWVRRRAFSQSQVTMSLMPAHLGSPPAKATRSMNLQRPSSFLCPLHSPARPVSPPPLCSSSLPLLPSVCLLGVLSVPGSEGPCDEVLTPLFLSGDIGRASTPSEPQFPPVQSGAILTETKSPREALGKPLPSSCSSFSL